MSEPTTVTYSVPEVLMRIEDKIDSNQKELKQDIKDVNTKLEKLNTIEVKLATIETDSREWING